MRHAAQMPSGAAIRFSAGGYTKTIPLSEGRPAKNYGEYVFSFGLAPYLMGENITAQIVYPDSLGSSLEYSAEEYVNALHEMYSDQPEMLALADSMLNYGKYAQAYNNDTTLSGYAENCVIGDELAYAVNEESDGIVIDNASLKLGSTVSINLQYEAADDGEYTFSCGDNELITSRNGKVYDVILDSILPQDFGTMYTFESSDGDTFSYSVFTYIRNNIGSDSKPLVNLLNAMYEYSIAAQEYISAIK